MYTISHRPDTFSKVVGQDSAVDFLRFVALNPDNAPRVIILHGPHGTGKTSLARVLAQSLACENITKKECDPCGKCPGCTDLLPVVEYDAMVLDDTAALNAARQYVMLHTGITRIAIFDEIHLLTPKKQASLLKALEEVSGNTFVIFATTEVDQIIDTIRSRAVEVPLYPIPAKLITEHLESVALSDDKEFDPEVLSTIALVSDGHLRDAMMMLTRYLLTGKSDFVTVLSETLITYFSAVLSGETQQVKASITRLQSFPTSQLQRALNQAVSEIVQAYVSRNRKSVYYNVARSFGGGSLTLLQYISEPWFQQTFKDEHLATSALWALYMVCNGETGSTPP